jgi:hypothetical protein
MHSLPADVCHTPGNIVSWLLYSRGLVTVREGGTDDVIWMGEGYAGSCTILNSSHGLYYTLKNMSWP